MRRIPLLIWLSVWAVWLWLGVRLHRELPRELGDPIASLELEDGERVVGFLRGSNSIVTSKAITLDGPRIYFRNARTGDVEHRISAPQTWLDASLKHGVTFGNPNGGTDRPPGAGFLDLRTGRWTVLDFHHGCGPFYHPWRAWAMFLPSIIGQDLVAVADIRTGRRMFRWRPPNPTIDDFYCAFWVGDDRIGICLRKNHPINYDYTDADYRVELWKIEGGDEPLQVFDGLSVGEDRSTSRGGRVAWRWKNQPSLPVDVFDFNLGRFAFRDPPMEERKADPTFKATDVGATVLSEDGRTLLLQSNDSLWSVDAGRRLWKGLSDADDVMIGQSTDLGGRFQTRERWKFDLSRWSYEHAAYAVRDLRTGRVLYRCSAPTTLFSSELSSDGGLFRHEGWVYSLPPPANWTLLAVAQFVLALPIVVAWVVLRLRRRRAGDVNPLVRPLIHAHFD